MTPQEQEGGSNSIDEEYLDSLCKLKICKLLKIKIEQDSNIDNEKKEEIKDKFNKIVSSISGYFSRRFLYLVNENPQIIQEQSNSYNNMSNNNM